MDNIKLTIIAKAFNLPFFINAGRIPDRQSQINELAGWANDQERKLQRLHCGQVLPRERHRMWAEQEIDRRRVVYVASGRAGIICRRSTLPNAIGAHHEVPMAGDCSLRL